MNVKSIDFSVFLSSLLKFSHYEGIHLPLLILLLFDVFVYYIIHRATGFFLLLTDVEMRSYSVGSGDE